MSMEGKKKYRYTIKTHSMDDVLDRLEKMGKSPLRGGNRVMYCDTSGACMLDEVDSESPYREALQSLLNDEAETGKRLMQVLFRERQMITVWEESHRED
jgi:hypothetical protein